MVIEELTGIGIAILAVGGGLLIALVSVLVWQRIEMTKVLHGKHVDPQLDARLSEIESKVSALSDKFDRQALEHKDR